MSTDGQHVKPAAALKLPKIGTLVDFRCERCGCWVPIDTTQRCPKAKT